MVEVFYGAGCKKASSVRDEAVDEAEVGPLLFLGC